MERDFAPQPYKSETKEESIEQVSEMIVKNKRPLLQMRISKPRYEFGHEGFNLVDREGGETLIDVKPAKQMNFFPRRKILEIGLQAANQMKSFRSQTYF